MEGARLIFQDSNLIFFPVWENREPRPHATDTDKGGRGENPTSLFPPDGNQRHVESSRESLSLAVRHAGYLPHSIWSGEYS